MNGISYTIGFCFILPILFGISLNGYEIYYLI